MTCRHNYLLKVNSILRLWFWTPTQNFTRNTDKRA